MKKLLSLLSVITISGTSTTSLVACNMPQEYTKEQLEKLKIENQINTTNENIKNNLEWIAPQEKPFNKIDNKWYYVSWKGNNKWNINKFKNDKFPNQIIPNNYNGKDKILINYGRFTVEQRPKELYFVYRDSLTIKYWSDDDGTYFKSVYRWNGEENNLPTNLDIDENGNLKVCIL